MHAQSGITNVADVYNLSKYNSRIMAAFLPEYEKVELWKIQIFENPEIMNFLKNYNPLLLKIFSNCNLKK